MGINFLIKTVSSLNCLVERRVLRILTLLVIFSTNDITAQTRVLDTLMHYIQKSDKPEWEEFEGLTSEKEFVVHFDAMENAAEQTIGLRQYDVKQRWQVVLNGQKLGNLIRDVNHLNLYLPVPPKVLRTGRNMLTVTTLTPDSDDIMVGNVTLYSDGQNKVVNEAKLEVEVIDKRSNTAIPSRITIINKDRVLQMTGAVSGNGLATRSGNIYTSNGKASFGLPAGQYTVYATRGFEYGVDSARLSISPGEQLKRKLAIGREVDTKGWISSDTHIHTYTYSGHGDATIEERALSIAGEGIELPIITDHNIKVDLAPAMKSVGVKGFYTPVTGMEYTTNLGHFNVFPVSNDTALVNTKLKNWDSVSSRINPTQKSAVILNHARDIHIGFRPFDAKRHLAIAGQSVNNWKIPANAMELINSGSLQTEIFRLYKDWFGLLNRAIYLTPVGSSDSHDVSQYLVGQARTYIKANDEKADEINIAEAVENFRQGKVGVSFGLFTQIKVNNKYAPGDLVPASDKVAVAVEVLGPGWTKADRVSLYANGKKIREASITKGNVTGLKWKGGWVLPKLKQDVVLVAIAEGPYTYLPYWPLVKPFQPTSSKWTPGIISSTGAVWIDNDGDGTRSSAYDYARREWKKSNGNIYSFLRSIDGYDEAVAVQAASLLQQQGWTLIEPNLQKALDSSKPATKAGFISFRDEWSQSKKSE